MKRTAIICLFLMLSSFALAQADSAVLDRNFVFKDGIFLNFQQVLNNNPVPKSKIITDISQYDLDFYDKLLEKKTLKFYYNGTVQEVNTGDIWGYSDNGSLYIHWNDEFNKIPVVGSLGHFIASKLVTTYSSPYSSWYYDPYDYNTTTTREIFQYILDFRTGKVYDFTVSSLLYLMQKYDKELYDEYSKLSRRKRKKMMFYYLRKFNSRNKIYLPKQ